MLQDQTQTIRLVDRRGNDQGTDVWMLITWDENTKILENFSKFTSILQGHQRTTQKVTVRIGFARDVKGLLNKSIWCCRNRCSRKTGTSKTLVFLIICTSVSHGHWWHNEVNKLTDNIFFRRIMEHYNYGSQNYRRLLHETKLRYDIYTVRER